MPPRAARPAASHLHQQPPQSSSYHAASAPLRLRRAWEEARQGTLGTESMAAQGPWEQPHHTRLTPGPPLQDIRFISIIVISLSPFKGEETGAWRGGDLGRFSQQDDTSTCF